MQKKIGRKLKANAEKIGFKLKANAEEDWKETEGKYRRRLEGS